VGPGDRVDLLLVAGAPDHPQVSPFALGVPVRSASPGGLLVEVGAREAPALVYASLTARLVALVVPAGAGAGATAGEEPAVDSLDEAQSLVSR
jgi:hypothetical protein